MKFSFPTCSLIVTTYNWPEALNLSLRSIFTQSVLPTEIIVADDGSNENTAMLIKNISNEFNFPIKHCWQEDKGFRLARNRNNAIIESNSDYIIFIDGDIILHKDFVKDHLLNAQKGKFVNGSRVILSSAISHDLISGRINNIGMRFIFQKNSLNGLRIPFLHRFVQGPQYTIGRIKGCNMAFWKSDLIDVNGFDESFVGWGREDSDIAIRLMNNGVARKNLKFCAIQYHIYHNEQSQELLIKNDEILQNVIRNKFIKAKIGLNER